MEILLSIVTTLATVVIAWSAWMTKKSQDKFQKELKDLYQAMVISNLLSSNSDPNQLDGFIGKFKQFYKGETEIFK